MLRRTVTEWQNIGYGDADHEIPVRLADRLAAAASRSSLAKSHGAGVLEHGRHGLRAKGIVGTVAAEGCQLEILPKIQSMGDDASATHVRHRLVHMLATVWRLPLDAGDAARLCSQSDTLLEILIRMFVEKLSIALQSGMPRLYDETSNHLPVLRGRLDVARQYTELLTAPGRMACRHDNLTPNIPINQMIKATVTHLARVSCDVDNQRRLRELAHLYADIDILPPKTPQPMAFDRGNARWRALYNLAEALLGHRFQTTSSGASQGFALLFDMSRLFESYVAQLILRAVRATDLCAVVQGGKRHCLATVDGQGLFETRPDILLKRNDKVVQVIDTKWKKIAADITDSKHGVSQADVYQMMAYGRLYDCNRLTLVYPHHPAMGAGEGRVSAHKIRASDHTLEVVTLDVALMQDLTTRVQRLLAIHPF